MCPRDTVAPNAGSWNDRSRPDPNGRMTGRDLLLSVDCIANDGSRPDQKGRRPVVARVTTGRDHGCDKSFGALVHILQQDSA